MWGNEMFAFFVCACVCVAKHDFHGEKEEAAALANIFKKINLLGCLPLAACFAASIASSAPCLGCIFRWLYYCTVFRRQPRHAGLAPLNSQA